MNIPRSRRLLRLVCGTMILVVSLLCVFLGTSVWNAQRQRAAVVWVLGLGGEVQYDRDIDGGIVGVDWLCALVGVDYFATVVAVELYTTDASHGDLSPLSYLPELEHLSLDNAQSSDLSAIGKLLHLDSLCLEAAPGVVVDLAPLSNLQQLRSLQLWVTEATDLSPLAKITRLHGLSLGAPGSDLSPLASLTELKSLDLYGAAGFATELGGQDANIEIALAGYLRSRRPRVVFGIDQSGGPYGGM